MGNQIINTYKQLLLEIIMKLMATCALGYFSVAIIQSYQNTKNIVLLLLLLSESITILLVIAAKFTNTRDFSPLVIIATIAGTFYFFAISLDGGIPLISSNISAFILCVGICWQLYAKIYLGRSFGLLPACRSIVDTGPYKLVRHPIYFGYFIGHMAFLLNNFSWWNVEVLTLLYLFQFLRMHYEEQVLSKNEQYREYKKRVKYRFIPFLL
jgi:isoprenylcysteine carboxyl methyltransferase